MIGAIRAYGPALAYPWAALERRFVILTTGRTGSELLVSLLDSHPEIRCDGEILAERRAMPDRLIRSRLVTARLRGARAWGFKLLRDHLLRQSLGAPEDYVQLLHRHGFRVILLERRDLLQQAISYVRAAGQERYHHRRGDGAGFAATDMDPLQVLATMFVIEDSSAWARAAVSGIPHLHLVYEDDLATSEHQQASADRVSQWLGLSSAPVRSDIVRISPRGTAEQLTNFDELADLLRHTRYARYVAS